jgi:hypothetical protein
MCTSDVSCVCSSQYHDAVCRLNVTIDEIKEWRLASKPVNHMMFSHEQKQR